jgi:hypothetical protein
MLRARHEFAPAVTIQQAIDRAVIDLVFDLFLKGTLDLSHDSDLSTLSLSEKRGEERLLFFPREILMPTPSFAWRFDGCRSQTIVG